MKEPFENNLPENLVQRAVAFARGLAFGVTQGWWRNAFYIVPSSDGTHKPIWGLASAFASDHHRHMFEIKMQSWLPHAPSADLMMLFGYLIRKEERSGAYYEITPKALELLKQPAVQPSIFICYAREQSSAFALLIHARLEARGAYAFIDKQIPGGAEWEALLQNTIQSRSNHFICVMGPKTLERPYVQKEIQWAHEAGLFMIPVWHSGFSEKEHVPENEVIRSFVESRNAIIVGDESALAYDNAVNQLLNQLEFATASDLNPLLLP
jgi:hypothetical protein